MDDEKREHQKEIILSWLKYVAYPVGLCNIRTKENGSLINKYCDGISCVENSPSASKDEIGWNMILECFIESLNIPLDFKLKPNHTPKDFQENLNTIFKSLGIPKGIEDVFAIECTQAGNPEAKRIIREAKGRADALRGTNKWRTEAGSAQPPVSRQRETVNEDFGLVRDKNILDLPISAIPANLFSKELKDKLSQRFSFVYELLTITFDELKQILSKNGNISTRLLVELEFFFKSNSIDFLNHIGEPSEPQDILVKTVIRDTVTIALSQITKSKENIV